MESRDAASSSTAVSNPSMSSFRRSTGSVRSDESVTAGTCDDRGRLSLVPGLLDHRVAPGAGLLVAGAGEEGDRSRLRGQRGVDRAHVVETVMGDVLAQQGEGDRVGLQSQHAGVRDSDA